MCHSRESGIQSLGADKLSDGAAREFSGSLLRPATPWTPAFRGHGAVGSYKCRGGRRKSLKRLKSAKESEGFNLDFVPLDLEFVPPGLDFVPKNLDFLPPD
jgi:hypothetical protein